MSLLPLWTRWASANRADARSWLSLAQAGGLAAASHSRAIPSTVAQELISGALSLPISVLLKIGTGGTAVPLGTSLGPVLRNYRLSRGSSARSSGIQTLSAQSVAEAALGLIMDSVNAGSQLLTTYDPESLSCATLGGFLDRLEAMQLQEALTAEQQTAVLDAFVSLLQDNGVDVTMGGEMTFSGTLADEMYAWVERAQASYAERCQSSGPTADSARPDRVLLPAPSLMTGEVESSSSGYTWRDGLKAAGAAGSLYWLWRTFR